MRTDDTDRSSAGPDARLARLEAELATARAEIVELRRRVEVEPGSAALSRRRLLLGAAAAAAGAGAALADAAPVAAANGDPLRAGQAVTESTGAHLQLDSAGPNAYGFLVSDNGFGGLPVPVAPYGGSVVGVTQGAATLSGVLGLASGAATAAVRGYVDGGDAVGVWGQSRRIAVRGDAELTSSSAPSLVIGAVGSATVTGPVAEGSLIAGVAAASNAGHGVWCSGAAGALYLDAYDDSVPPTRSRAAVRNAIDVDRTGRLWHCVATGTPGTWRQLSGPDTAGAFHAITPTRVYDTRAAAPSPGRLVAGESRQVSVADGRDLTTGAVTVSGLVPDGATAITCNVTVVATAGAGFVTVNPGGVTTVSAATVNWSAAGQILNNGVVAAIATDRTVTMVVGGTGASTDVVIDVTGYFR